MRLPRDMVFGRDYDGWALPLGKGPKWSHFVPSPGQPSCLPKGCVPVKLVRVYFGGGPRHIGQEEED